MNDRFKFRYFNKYANKMVKPENWQNVDGIYECIRQQVCFDEDIAPLPYDHIGNGLVFMQCTGLKDKNGKLIYEGDILGGIYHGYIEYCKDCKCFQLFVKDYGCLACEGDLHWYELVEAEEQNELEVIGNIYENKELLESEG